MILVIGSAGAGKTDFVKNLGYTDAQIADGRLNAMPVLDRLEQLVFADPACVDPLLPELLQKEVVICREVGCGVIPALRADRLAREATGRLCILLAREATAVVRLVCGIPTAIKGTLPERSGG